MNLIVRFIVNLLVFITIAGIVLKVIGFYEAGWIKIITPLFFAFVIKYLYEFLKKKLKIN